VTIRICGDNLRTVPQFRLSEAARLLGVSDDTVRRWVDAGHLTATSDRAGRKVVDGAELAAYARANAELIADPTGVGRSARNRFVGLVTSVVTDKVMAQVEMQCGPHRVVSLMSTEAVGELGLEPGALAVAIVKATQVVVETPEES
jgi:molybdopterin-binding protein